MHAVASRSALSRSRRAVALVVETSNRYARELLRGVRAYLAEHDCWTVHLTEQGRGDEPPRWLKNWHGEGILARIENERIAAAVREVGVPVVNVSAAGYAPEFPRVISDSAGVARLAAEHLLERGFRHFGYCGDARFQWSREHGRNFDAVVRQAGCRCDWFPSDPTDFEDWDRERRKLAHWLRCLPRPVGIMACYDIRGQQVLDVCRQEGLEVPDEVAVIGQHNDEVLCELCAPPLSSVIPNARRAGYEAAALLERMMEGEEVAPVTLGITPLGVATRQSTDVIAIEDRQIAEAVRFIREHACEAIGVEEVMRVAGMSRTLLERRFRRLLGRSPYEEVLRVKLQRAKQLLARTDLTIAEIAERAGFGNAEYLSASFRKRTGMSPREYRRRERQPR